MASEGVRQGQVPIMRIIGKGGFSKNNGEIGAPIIFALRNRLACSVFHSPQADERCQTPEPLPLFYSPLSASDIPFRGGGRGRNPQLNATNSRIRKGAQWSNVLLGCDRRLMPQASSVGDSFASCRRRGANLSSTPCCLWAAEGRATESNKTLRNEATKAPNTPKTK